MPRSLIIICCLFTFASCTVVRDTTHTTPGNEALFLYRWDLSTLNGSELAESGPYLIFTAGETYRVTGFGGCNILMGAIALTGSDSINFRPMGSTTMTCTDMQTEQAFLEVLNTVTTFKVEGNTLSLLLGTQVLATFNGTTFAALEEAASMVTNGTWNLTYLYDLRGTIENAFPLGAPTLIISMPNTKASGVGGCNSYSADIKIKDKAMSFGPISATKMYCDGVAESVYFADLEKVDAWEMEDNNNLTLLNQGVPYLRFTRK